MDNKYGSILTFNKGAYIIVEGKKDSRFFIIQEGHVQLSLEEEVVEERDGLVFGPGDFFGVVAAMSLHAHLETAKAMTDVTVLAVNVSDFDVFIQQNKDIALSIILFFSNRMRFLNKELTQMTLNDETEGEDTSHLFDLGKFYYDKQKFDYAYFAYRQYIRFCPDGENIEEAKRFLAELKPYALTLPFVTLKNRRIYAEDTILYAQGEPSEEFYVIQSGSVRVTKVVNDNEVLLSILKAGDVVGEMSILDSKPRSVTAIVNESSTLFVITKKNFDEIVVTSPQIIGLLMRSLSERIWFLYKHLYNATLQYPIARLYDTLLIKLEKVKVPLESDGGYACDFGVEELVSMTSGLVGEDAEKAVQKFLSNPNIIIVDDKIHIKRISSITKECNYFKSIDRRKKAFLSQ